MSHSLGNVSKCHNPSVSFGVSLLKQKVYYEYYYGSIVAEKKTKHKHEPSQGKVKLLEMKKRSFIQLQLV